MKVVKNIFYMLVWLTIFTSRLFAACFDDNATLSLLDSVVTIESKIDTITGTVCTIESKVDVTANIYETVESKACVIESGLDTALENLSILDVVAVSTNTLESNVDVLAIALQSTQNDVCTLESKVDLFALQINTLESKIEILDMSSITLISKVDVIDTSVTNAFQKACTLDSSVEIVQTNLNSSELNLLTIESKVDVIDGELDTLVNTAQTTQSIVEILEGKIDAHLVDLDDVENKVCTVLSFVEVIDTTVDATTLNSITMLSKIDKYEGNFQQTWTAIEAGIEKSCTVDSLADLIENTLEEGIGVSQEDIDGTFTALAALEEKLCLVESKLGLVGIQADDISGTFTALDGLLKSVCTLESKVDLVDTNIMVEINNLVECLGTEITSTLVGTTGYTISSSGNYFLGENIAYAASGTDSAITINADNVTLDMCDKTLRQSSGGAANGIELIGSAKNVIISNGTVRSFNADNILCGSGTSGLVIENMMVLDAGDNNIEVVDGSDIIINQVIANGAIDGILMGAVTDVVIKNSLISDNSLLGIGVLIGSGAAENVCILQSCILNNGDHGIHCNAQTGTFSKVIIENCALFSNSLVGIRFDGISASVIKNNISLSNTTTGIRITTSNDIELKNNICSNNGGRGFFITGAGGNHILLGNVSTLNTAANFEEDGTTGANSIFSNWALKAPASEASNYLVMATTINKSIVDQAGTFPSPNPRKWHNISMTT